jgi:tetratricopeptide (TPR) repeat protein
MELNSYAAGVPRVFETMSLEVPKRPDRSPALRCGLLLCWLLLAQVCGSAAETNILPAIAPVAATNDPAATERQLRHYLKLQEQLHATLLAIEQARLESSLEARTNAEALTARLEQLERSLAQQREQHLQASKESSHTVLWIGGGIVGLGLVALVISMFLQSRGVNRLAQVADGFQHDRALLGAGLPLGTSSSDRLLLGNGSANGPNKTLLSTIDRLERRVQELEGTATTESSEDTLALQPADENPRRRNGTGERRPADQVSVLLGKGNVLLSLAKAEEALTCFNDAIGISPNLAEAHLKRGLALERLKRLDDAVEAYDRAITLNKSLTQAYLSKGGIYNLQERYNEALECYERALRSEVRS